MANFRTLYDKNHDFYHVLITIFKYPENIFKRKRYSEFFFFEVTILRIVCLNKTKSNNNEILVY